MYQAQTYRMPAAAPQPSAQRRHPLSNTNAVNHHHVNHPQQQEATPPPKPPPKAPSSPPLPRQNSKTTPPSPPKIITDKSGRLQFSRVGFLGEVRLFTLCEWHGVSDMLIRAVLHEYMRCKMFEAQGSHVRSLRNHPSRRRKLRQK